MESVGDGGCTGEGVMEADLFATPTLDNKFVLGAISFFRTLLTILGIPSVFACSTLVGEDVFIYYHVHIFLTALSMK